VPYNGSTVEALDKIMTEFKPDYIFYTLGFTIRTKITRIQPNQPYQLLVTCTIYSCMSQFHHQGVSYAPFRAQVYFDVSDSITEKNGFLYEKHKSQHAKYGERWIEAIEGRAKIRGFENGCKYAEAFEAVRLSIHI
jgi:hypothetical protein